MDVEKANINLVDKYVGYRLDETDPAEIPNTVTDGDTIKVYYEKDNFNYTVEYYYDGVINSEKTDEINATYLDEISK